MVYYYIQKLKKNNGLLKEYLSNQKKLKYWKNIQNYLYSFIRIPVLAYFTGNFFINNYKNKENLKKGIILFPVYLMGLYWSYKIVSGKKNKKTEN